MEGKEAPGLRLSGSTRVKEVEMDGQWLVGSSVDGGLAIWRYGGMFGMLILLLLLYQS